MEKLKISKDEILTKLIKNLCTDLKNIFNKDITTSSKYLKKRTEFGPELNVNIIGLEVPEILKIKLEYTVSTVNINNIINDEVKIIITKIKNNTDTTFNLNLNQLNLREKLLFKLINEINNL